jgi:hypothetical protein
LTAARPVGEEGIFTAVTKRLKMGNVKGKKR